MNSLSGNLANLFKLAADENFRKFVMNPKVQELMQDDEFKRLVEEKNIMGAVSNPRFSELMKDPELRTQLQAIGRKLKET